MASCGLYNLNQNRNDNFQSYSENQEKQKFVSNTHNKSNQDKQEFLNGISARINRSAQMIEKQFSLNNKLGQIVNSQYDDLVYQDLGVQLETDRQYNNDDDTKYQY
ncbi:hypothetical protein PPERSA_11565 [Pseudocohnilembus persalinus]|uniref:Uncharacterized protein n=1 Tax=Pseudocohnilembus persalinus TaxID=266149 RepID=A0A0V0QA71_PSEPJ|nr:hypothetical protein PPERSA_11565 [Pseudocohnilembus persalinus]|eukprot:KRW98964.1 hypothetical protein PPERSA_11565 [Pseudocohnilembus persalinus]